MRAVETTRAAALAEPHHDGSELYVAEHPAELGDRAVLRVRVPDGVATEVMLRYVRDGEPRTVNAVVDEESDGETWWRAELPAENPVIR
jgi:alpha-glucosidase